MSDVIVHDLDFSRRLDIRDNDDATALHWAALCNLIDEEEG